VKYDTEAADECVLGLLYLSLHNENRVWKRIPFEIMDRLHEAGMISTPVGKAESVVLTEEGLARCKELFKAKFGKHA
jgi:Domain of unknown function (DUF6429)